ncbi:MAG: Gldg family protein [Lentisphaeria bacterium]|nr:Gldg family protein [Lentisphaeria bacterium]
MSMRSFRVVRAVWKREFAASAASAAPWIFLIIFLVLAGFLSFIVSGIFTYGQADLTPFFGWLPWLFVFLVPALGMPFWSEERRTGTMELLLSFPCTIRELVWGKFLAGMSHLALALVLTAGVPLSAVYLGKPDIGTIFCGYAGAFLLGGVFLAAASFCSALTQSQTASFLLSLVICGLFMVIGAPDVLDWLGVYLPDSLVNLLASVAFLPHYQAFQRGFVDTGDLVYCLSGMVFFLYLAEIVLKFIASGTGNVFVSGAWSVPGVRREIGLLCLRVIPALYILLCVNLIGSAFSLKTDLSQDGAYSLSPEAKEFARSLKTNAEIRFYVSSSSPHLPAVFKRYAERVEWLLRSLCEASGGKLSLVVLDPEPDSGDEQAAGLEGITPISINTGDRVYLGLSVSCGDRTLSLPFLSLQQEKMLEYDVVRTVLNAVSVKRPKIGVMSAFKVLGDQLPTELTAMDPSQVKVFDRAWYVISELGADYELVPLALDAGEIPADLAAVLIIHPVGIQPRALYALDQYLMRGGRMAVFLDPRSFYAVLKIRSDYSMSEKITSSLDPLTSAWGVSCNPGMVAADLIYAHRRVLPERMITNPTALELSGDAISRQTPVTALFNSVSMWFASPLAVTPVKGISSEILLRTSPNSQPVSMYVAERPELVIRNFRPGGKPLALGVHLTGDFPSAYPKGPPLVMPRSHKHLQRSGGKGEVYLFGDSDMLFNDLCVKLTPDAYGQKTPVRQNDNAALLQNIMEQLTESNRFLSRIRGRNPMSRPLTRYNALRAHAELNYKDRIQELEQELRSATLRMNRIRASLGASKGEIRLSPEQKQLIREYHAKTAQVTRELKEVRKQLRADLNRLDTWLRLINLAAVPLAVAVIGLIWASLRFSRWRKRS